MVKIGNEDLLRMHPTSAATSTLTTLYDSKPQACCLSVTPPQISSCWTHGNKTVVPRAICFLMQMIPSLSVLTCKHSFFKGS